MAITITTPATFEPITLAEARTACRVEHEDDDTLLRDTLIPQARQYVETHTGLTLCSTGFLQTLAAFPCSDRIILTRGPLGDVASVKYRDASDVLQTLDASNYRAYGTGQLDEVTPGRLVLVYGSHWPATNVRDDAVEVRYTAGWATAATIPPMLRRAVAQVVVHLYEHNLPVGGADDPNLGVLRDALWSWRMPVV